MVDILKNGDDMQVVKLSERYGTYSTQLTTATLTESHATIDFLQAQRKSKQFSLTASELDALTDAWTQFKHTVQVAKELEQKRIIEAARRRIDELGATAITIEQGSADESWYYIRYSHQPRWDYGTDVHELDIALSRLLERIQDYGLSLTADEVPSAQPEMSSTIVWTGDTPPNTSFSIDF